MKKIGILGTGTISTVITKKLINAGYEVMVGGMAESQIDSFGNSGILDAAFFGDLLFLCMKKENVLTAVNSLPLEFVCSKTIIDITNPLDYSDSIPPYMVPELINSNSLGEELQDALPGANIVKALNLSSNDVMVNAKKYNGRSTMFITGNDARAKMEAKEVLYNIGWKDIVDLGDTSVRKRTEELHIARRA